MQLLKYNKAFSLTV